MDPTQSTIYEDVPIGKLWRDVKSGRYKEPIVASSRKNLYMTDSDSDQDLDSEVVVHTATESNRAPPPPMALRIPHVFIHHDEGYLRGAFERLGIATVNKIRLSEKQNAHGKKFNTAVLYINEWKNTPAAKEIINKLQGGETDVRVEHNSPQYWFVQIYRHVKPIGKTADVSDEDSRELLQQQARVDADLISRLNIENTRLREALQQSKEQTCADTDLISRLTIENTRLCCIINTNIKLG